MGGGAIAEGVLGNIGGNLAAFGQAETAKANAKSARFNRDRARIQMGIRDAVSHKNERQVSGSNITATTKAGVRRAGSPIEVEAANAFEAERRRFLARQAALTEIDLLTYQADSAIITGGFAAVATSIKAGSSSGVGFAPAGTSSSGDQGGDGLTRINARASEKIRPANLSPNYSPRLRLQRG